MARREMLRPEGAERVLSWRHTVHSRVRAKTKPAAEQRMEYFL